MTRVQRFFARLWPEGSYVAQLQAWAAAEPVITPLPLPAIRPLVAVPAARQDRVARFKLRMTR